ncbi:MAG: TIGR02391 family protein [Bacteroidetes bacterium 4484_276]|nr:MAG: TIGR02391 family protein [Bacteroidetes bacterium 4484_276]
MSKKFPIIQPNILESICRIVADTSKGLKGSELSKAILDAKMKDVSPEMTKWRRLYNSCVEVQDRTGCSNNILTLIQKSYHPSQFINNKETFEERRSELNKVLSFIGLKLNEKGKFNPIKKSETISDAQQRATLLLSKLKERNVHPDVLEFCKSELLQENYFHAVFEATKSVADKIRQLTGLTDDGSSLVTKVFNVNNPILKINSLSDETKKSEQKGFSNLLIGFFGMFRNTTAHAPRIYWEINESDALDIMTMASMLHRRIDSAERT